MWNPGELPPPLSPEALRGPHGSYPRNPLLERAFYHAGMIEQWGTGTTKIIALCREQGLPEPEFADWQGGLRLSFAKDPYTPERLEAMGLNERQVHGILYLKEQGKLTNRELSDYAPMLSPAQPGQLQDGLRRQGAKGPRGRLPDGDDVAR